MHMMQLFPSFLPSHRFAEQVSPLLVQAQHKLASRIAEHGGSKPPQPHFARAQQQLGGPVTAELYVKLQLKVELQEGDTLNIDPGAHMDPEGHDAYSGNLLCGSLMVSSSLPTINK